MKKLAVVSLIATLGTAWIVCSSWQNANEKMAQADARCKAIERTVVETINDVKPIASNELETKYLVSTSSGRLFTTLDATTMHVGKKNTIRINCYGKVVSVTAVD